MRRISPILAGAAAGISLALSFTAGFLLRDFFIQQWPVSAAGLDQYPLLHEVQQLLDRIYLREQPDHQVRQYAAIRGMLSSLQDTNTFFIEPPVAQSEAQALAGTYGGIGVQLNRNNEGMYIIYPFEDSPARRAGIEDGDILLTVNGEAILGAEPLDTVDQRLRGEVKEGNGVELLVRKKDGQDFSAFVLFEVINVPSVVFRLVDTDERIGYLQVLRFTNRTPTELRAGIENLKASGMEALILDLRDNSGGLLEESIQVASEFLAGGVVTVEESKLGVRTYDVRPGGQALTIPLAVLVNNRTASASELVAGALRDQERAVLIGQRTYGKGTVQQIFSLSDGSSVHITSAEWFTPARIPLDGVGLEPNISITPVATQGDAELNEALRFLRTTLDESD